MSDPKIYQDIKERLKKSGDTITGNLQLDTTSDSRFFTGTNSAQSVGMKSTSSDTTGASITLTGGTASSDAGSFKLTAASGGESTVLKGTVGGSLNWGGAMS